MRFWGFAALVGLMWSTATQAATLAIMGPFTSNSVLVAEDFNHGFYVAFQVSPDDTLSFSNSGFAGVNLPVWIDPDTSPPFMTTLTSADGQQFDDAADWITDEARNILAVILPGYPGLKVTAYDETSLVLSDGVPSLLASDITEISLIVTGLQATETTVMVRERDTSVFPPVFIEVEKPAFDYSVTYRVEIQGIPEPAAVSLMAALIVSTRLRSGRDRVL